MSLLNIQKVTSWVANIHEVTLCVIWIFKKVASWVFWIFMNWHHGYFEYSKGDVTSILNIHEVTSCVFWIFTKWHHGFIEYSKVDVMDIFMKWGHGYNEYSWSDVMGILNIHEVTSCAFWIFKKIMSWVFWKFMKWRHGHYEYSWSDILGILNILDVTSWVFWIFKRWHKLNIG